LFCDITSGYKNHFKFSDVTKAYYDSDSQSNLLYVLLIYQSGFNVLYLR